MRMSRRSLLAAAISVPALVTTANAQETPDPPWMIMAGMGSGPVGRWSHNLILDTLYNRLLVIGGRDASGVVRGDLWSFDIGTYTWSELDLSGPSARFGSATAPAPDGSGFYSFGGQSDDGVLGDFWSFDFASTTWRQIETATSPAARADARATVDALGRIVLSHGRNGADLLDDVWAFDPIQRRWTELIPLSGFRPQARYGHDMISLPDFGIMLVGFGSADATGTVRLGDLWSFDIYNSLWSEITPPTGPAPRTGAALARLGNTVLLVGGDTELGLQSDVWTGDLTQGYFVWTEFTPVNHGPLGIYRRAWHDMTAANGEYYVFGGLGVEGALSDLWKFSPERVVFPGEGGEVIEPA